MRIFLDSDGVVADFDKSARAILGEDPKAFETLNGASKFWEILESADRFYYNLEIMPDAMKLINYLMPVNPTILSGVPNNMPEAHYDKHQWYKDKLNNLFPVITCQSKDKFRYCTYGDILIDDTLKYRQHWEDMGGTFVHHTSAENTIRTLRSNIPFLIKLNWRILTD